MEAQIENYPDFAIVWSFFNKFGKHLEMEDVLITDVIQWLKVQSAGSACLVDVVVKLMRKTGMRVDKQRWQKQLSKAVVKHNVTLAFELQNQGFFALQVAKKLQIFKLLCEMQFDENLKFKNTINIEEADEQRLQPVGRDEDGLVYWHHEDNELNIRLYVEDEDEEEDCGWKVICRNKDDIGNLIQQLTDEPIQRKLSTESEEEEESNLVESKFQKFLKSQCTTEAGDEGKRLCKKEYSVDTSIKQEGCAFEHSNDQTSVKKEPGNEMKENDKIKEEILDEETTVSVRNNALENNAENFTQQMKSENMNQVIKNSLSALPLEDAEENKINVASLLGKQSECSKTEGSERMEVGKSDMNKNNTADSSLQILDETPQVSASKIADVDSVDDPDSRITDQSEDVATKDCNIELTGLNECEVPVEIHQTNKSEVNGLKADCSHEKDQEGPEIKITDVEPSKQGVTSSKDHVNLGSVIYKDTDSTPEELDGESQSTDNAFSSVIFTEGSLNTDTSNSTSRVEDKALESNSQKGIVKSSDRLTTEQNLSATLSPAYVGDVVNTNTVVQCSVYSIPRSESSTEIMVSSKAVSVIKLTNTVAPSETDSLPVVAEIKHVDGSDIPTESEHTSIMDVKGNSSGVTESCEEKSESSEQTKGDCISNPSKIMPSDNEKSDNTALGNTENARGTKRDNSGEVKNHSETSVMSLTASHDVNIQTKDDNYQEHRSKEITYAKKEQETEAMFTDISDTSQNLPMSNVTTSQQSPQSLGKETEALQADSTCITRASNASGNETDEEKNEKNSDKCMKSSELILNTKLHTGKSNTLGDQATNDATTPLEETCVSSSAAQNQHEFSQKRDSNAEISAAEIEERKNDKDLAEEENQITFSKQTAVQEVTYTTPIAVKSEKNCMTRDGKTTEIFSDNLETLSSDKDAVDGDRLHSRNKDELNRNEIEKEIVDVVRAVINVMLEKASGELDDDKKMDNQTISDDNKVVADAGNKTEDVKDKDLCHGQDAGVSKEEAKSTKENVEESKQQPKGQKKKRRKRNYFTRKKTEPKQKSSATVANRTPRRKAAKKSQLDQLKADADLLFQEKSKEKKPDNAEETYRTRSGRIVKTAKKENTWQAFGDADDLNKEIRKKEDADKDFRFTESRKTNAVECEKKIPVKKKKVIDDTPCMKCGLSTHPQTILLCDSCDKGHHMACLTPPLMIVPDDEWFCPKCNQAKLISKLKEIHAELGSRLKAQERKAKQTQYRKMINEYTGISASNIIEQTKPVPKKNIPKRQKKIPSSSGSELESLSYSSPSSPEVIPARRCRNRVSYDFSSFDKTIMDAIKSDIEAVSDVEKERPVSGKDIRTIIAAEKGENALDEKEFKENKLPGRRKKRKLTLGNLKSSDSEEADSGSNFSISSNSEMSEEEFQEPEISDDDSLSDEIVGRRRGLRRRKRLLILPRKRSKRIRKRVIQEDWETSLSESSSDYEEVSKKKGKRKRNGYGRNSCNDSDEYVPSFAARERLFIDDNDHNEVKKRKRRRVINTSSSDDKANQDKKNIQSTKANSSDDCKWSSLSSGAEISDEESASDHEAAHEINISSV